MEKNIKIDALREALSRYVTELEWFLEQPILDPDFLKEVMDGFNAEISARIEGDHGSFGGK